MTVVSAKQTGAPLPLCLIFGLILSGCGFQLRGVSNVPEALQPLALECAQPVPERLCRAVKNQLNLGKVRLASASEAAAVLKLKDFRQERRANAVTARAAAAEYTLRQSIALAVVSARQTPLLPTDRVTSAETYRYDETNVLAKQREEEALQNELAERLAQQVLFRLAPLSQTHIDALETAQ